MQDKTQNTKEVIPSVENKEELNRLSREFKPTDVKFLLALNMNVSKEDCMAAAKGMIERLKRFRENGYNHEKAGLDPKRYRHQIIE